MSAEKSPQKKLLPFWPHYILSEFIAWYVMLGILIMLAALVPMGLEERANPLETPAHVKPEWYFLAVYQFLKVAAVFNFLGPEAPRLTGVFLPMLGLVALIFLPFLDRGKKRLARERPLMLLITALVLIIVIGLTVWGQYS